MAGAIGRGSQICGDLPARRSADWAGVPGLRDDADAAVATVPGSDILQRLLPAPEARRWRIHPNQQTLQVHPPLMPLSGGPN